jgi:sirohydrochlorin cobaltochelatase
MTALILAAHGSHISPHTAGLVWRYVDQLRSMGVAEEITACFWKEMPAFRHVLDTVQSDEIIVVPVFTAQGYFSGTVIPSEMGLDGQITRRNGRTIYLTPTIGEHPYLETIVRQRVTDVLANLNPQDVTVAIIGHGTKRNPQSRDATRHQASQLRGQQLAAAVLDVYLDDEPSIPSIYESAPTSQIIAVPFFLAPGSHVTIDVPNALGVAFENFPAQVHGKTVHYTAPVGTDDAICRLIMELVGEVGSIHGYPPTSEQGRGASTYAPTNDKQGVGSSWNAFPIVGRDHLIQTVQDNGRFIFGELELTPDEVKPLGAGESARILSTPAEVREAVRENPFRPLATSKGLPKDWRVPISSSDMLHGVIETVYPGAVADWSTHQNGHFAAESLAAVCESQVGMFAELHKTASSAKILQTFTSLCNSCIRHSTWYFGSSPVGAIPCKSPCNLWLTQLKEAVH